MRRPDIYRLFLSLPSTTATVALTFSFSSQCHINILCAGKSEGKIGASSGANEFPLHDGFFTRRVADEPRAGGCGAANQRDTTHRAA
jgi:hypothetical protein